MHSICNLKYSVPKKILIAFHNGSNYDYHFIIKALAEEKQFTCLGKIHKKYTEKYINFTVQIEKEVTRIDEIHKIKCKYGHEDKKCETYDIKSKYCDCFLEYTHFKNDLIVY